MVKGIALLLLLLLSSTALAEEPSEERKVWALKKAYHMNGDSMVGWGAIDLSKEQPEDTKVVRIIPIIPTASPTPSLEKKK
jgi:hypothetical protein